MSRTLSIVCLVALLAAGALYLLRPGVDSEAPALEQPARPDEPAQAQPRVRLESGTERQRADELAQKPPTPPAPAEDLRAEGLRRGWQLPIGKGWWLDTLVNPGMVEPSATEIEKLQQRVATWSETLRRLQAQRAQRLDAYGRERVAAGLAVLDPEGVEPQPPSSGHEIVTIRLPESPGSVWHVDVGPGDDVELDAIERETANTWSSAILDLRRGFTAAKPQRP